MSSAKGQIFETSLRTSDRALDPVASNFDQVRVVKLKTTHTAAKLIPSFDNEEVVDTSLVQLLCCNHTSNTPTKDYDVIFIRG